MSTIAPAQLLERPRPSSLRPLRGAGLLTLASIGLVLITEAAHRGSVALSLEWASADPWRATANSILIVFLIAIVRVLINRRFLALCVVGMTLVAFASISAAKAAALGEPLTASDYVYVPQMLLLAGDVLRPLQLLWVLPVLAMPVLAWWLDRRWPKRLKWKTRALLLAVLVPLPTLVLLHAQLGITREVNMFVRSGTAKGVRFQAPRYRRTGFTMAIWTLIANGPAWPTCEGYSAAAVEEVLGRMPKAPEPSPTAGPAVRPHIIIVLSESLWDVSRLPNVSFASDPLPNLHSALAQTTARTFISPVMGGFTCNPEFELLTGWNMSLLPEGATPFIHYIRSPMPSLPRYLKEQGYRTIGMHPYHRQFWCRDAVYRYLGFDRFDALDSFGPTHILGTYVSDMDLVDRMIGELDAADAPTFLFGITMQNHGPYPPGLYPQRNVTFTHGLPEKPAGVLDTYIQGSYHADQAIGRLVRYVQSASRPTVLVVFGDHFPALGANYADATNRLAIPQLLGMVGNEPLTPSETLLLHSAPLLMMTNYPSEYAPPLTALSPSFVIPDILRLAGMDHPFYVGFLDQLRHAAPALTPVINLDSDLKPMVDLPPGARDLVRDYRILQHDILFGTRYSEPRLFNGR